MGNREFDVVLLGASGFVGALTAGHLAAAGSDARVALAGRSRHRLDAVRAGLGDAARSFGLVEVDASDAAGLRRLASRTSVLATTVGPYARLGREVVRAAADQGTHYADLTGELLFVRWTLDEIDARARETGARIVHSCGFDSVPSDLGVLLTAQRAASDGEGQLGQTTLVVRSLRGGISGGTLDSARQQAIAVRADPTLRRLLADPHALSPRRADEPPAGPTLRPGRDPRTGGWLGPFVMAPYNEAVVRLSNALSGWSYGRGLAYREASDFGRGPAAPLVSAAAGLGVRALSALLGWTPTRAVLDRLLPKPGEGPSADHRSAGRFRLEIDATTTTGARYRTTVAAEHDPGYDGTAIMLGQSALALALDTDDLPAASGVLTPATGLGARLAERLRAQGFVLDVERLG